MSSRFEFASPLTLLRQWRQSGGGLVEALVIGYTVDLPFLEKSFTSQARGLGARVTILTDAHQAIHDDVDVHQAGRSYLHGYALCAKAFHPKVVLLTDGEQTWCAIGSGNPTMSGWGHNNELYLVIRTDGQPASAALDDLADWLTRLPLVVTMPEWMKQILTEIAGLVKHHSSDKTDDDLRLVDNLDTPIISQLQPGPVDELGLSAPFYDPASSAVTRLIAHFRPAKVVLAIEPDLSRYDGASLATALSTAPAHQIRKIAGQRTWHGKLIEWRTNGAGHAMVGSPNLSSSALLRSTRDGGNCELAVICPTEQTLLPPGTPLGADALSTRRTMEVDPDQRESEPLVLLGVLRTPEGISIDLVARLRTPIVFEASASGGPGTWTRFHTLEEHDAEHLSVTCSADLAPGSVVRALTHAGGRQYSSHSAFVIDQFRCEPRTSSSETGLTRDYDPAALFTDDELADRFRKDLDRLLATAATAKSTGSASAPAAAVPVQKEDDRWGRWLNNVEQQLKPSLTGLLFPGGSEVPVSLHTRNWSIDLAEGVEELDEDEDTEELLPDRAARDRTAPNIAEADRQLWRRWDARLRRRITTADPPLPAELRMLAFRLHLDLLAAGLWGPDDKQWAAHLIELVDALLPGENDDPLPERVKSEIGILVAIGCALLFSELQQVGGTEIDWAAQSLWTRVSPWVADAETEGVAKQIVQARGYGRTVWLEAVLTLIERAGAARTDPMSEQRAQLRANGIDADFYDGAWVTDIGPARGARNTAALIAEAIGEPCAVVVRSDGGNCALLWSDGHIAYGDGVKRLWKRFRVRVVGGPRSTIAGPDGLAGALETRPIARPSQEIVSMGEAVDVPLQFLQKLLI